MYLLWCNEEKVNVAIFPPIVGTPWCAPIKVKHGAVSCRTPRGEHYKNVMGTRCKIRCKQGYESESSEVVCMASKHWSSNYACRGENWHPSEHAHIVSPHTHVCINTHTHIYFSTHLHSRFDSWIPDNSSHIFEQVRSWLKSTCQLGLTGRDFFVMHIPHSNLTFLVN